MNPEASRHFTIPLTFRALIDDPTHRPFPSFFPRKYVVPGPKAPQIKNLHLHLDFFTAAVCNLIDSQTELINDMLAYAKTWRYKPLAEHHHNIHHAEIGEQFLSRLTLQKAYWISAARFLSKLNDMFTSVLLQKKAGPWDHLLIRIRLRSASMSIWQHTAFTTSDMIDMWEILWGDTPNVYIKILWGTSRGDCVREIDIGPKDKEHTWLRLLTLRLKRRRGWDEKCWQDFRLRWPETVYGYTDTEPKPADMKEFLSDSFWIEKMGPVVNAVLLTIIEWDFF